MSVLDNIAHDSNLTWFHFTIPILVYLEKQSGRPGIDFFEVHIVYEVEALIWPLCLSLHSEVTCASQSVAQPQHV